MPVRIRLSRVGAKKRPFYRIVVADSRRSRDGKFIERIGTYNPMLSKDHPERIKINSDKAKEWIQKGAQPSDRVHLFLSDIGILEKPVITEKTKKHLPRKKAKESAEATQSEKDNKSKTSAVAKDSEEKPAETPPVEAKDSEEKPAETPPVEAKNSEEKPAETPPVEAKNSEEKNESEKK